MVKTLEIKQRSLLPVLGLGSVSMWQEMLSPGTGGKDLCFSAHIEKESAYAKSTKGGPDPAAHSDALWENGRTML